MNTFIPPKRILMGPGPSNVNPRVLGAMSGPTIGHLDPKFIELMDKIKELLNLGTLKDSQDFAIGFIIRGYIISKVTYLIESFRNQVEKPIGLNEEADEYMLKVKPMGTA